MVLEQISLRISKESKEKLESVTACIVCVHLNWHVLKMVIYSYK